VQTRRFDVISVPSLKRALNCCADCNKWKCTPSRGTMRPTFRYYVSGLKGRTRIPDSHLFLTELPKLKAYANLTVIFTRRVTLAGNSFLPAHYIAYRRIQNQGISSSGTIVSCPTVLDWNSGNCRAGFSFYVR
jgi:hypothetical protein